MFQCSMYDTFSQNEHLIRVMNFKTFFSIKQQYFLLHIIFYFPERERLSPLFNCFPWLTKKTVSASPENLFLLLWKYNNQWKLTCITHKDALHRVSREQSLASPPLSSPPPCPACHRTASPAQGSRNRKILALFIYYWSYLQIYPFSPCLYLSWKCTDHGVVECRHCQDLLQRDQRVRKHL